MAHSTAPPSRPTAITSASPAATLTYSSSMRGKTALPPSRTSSNWRKTKTADGTGTSYPAGVAFSPNGKFVYVAENVGDRLAVVNAATGEITQRFPTDHYPYGVTLTADGQVFVSAWGGSTVSQFRVLADGTLAYLGRIEVGRHPSALAVRGTRLYVTLAGSDRVAVVDTKLRKVARYLHDAAPGAPPEGSTPNAVAISSDRQASAGRRSRQQRRRRLRSCQPASCWGAFRPTGIRQRSPKSAIAASDPLRQRPRHPRQSGWAGPAHELAEREADGLHARTVEWQPAHAASASLPRATGALHPACRGREQLAAQAAQRNVIRRSSTWSTSSRRIAPTIRCWGT